MASHIHDRLVFDLASRDLAVLTGVCPVPEVTRDAGHGVLLLVADESAPRPAGKAEHGAPG
jgi:hypothetical protein